MFGLTQYLCNDRKGVLECFGVGRWTGDVDSNLGSTVRCVWSWMEGLKATRPPTEVNKALFSYSQCKYLQILKTDQLAPHSDLLLFFCCCIVTVKICLLND